MWAQMVYSTAVQTLTGNNFNVKRSLLVRLGRW
jgi:hypothetical protein